MQTDWLAWSWLSRIRLGTIDLGSLVFCGGTVSCCSHFSDRADHAVSARGAPVTHPWNFTSGFGHHIDGNCLKKRSCQQNVTKSLGLLAYSDLGFKYAR